MPAPHALSMGDYTRKELPQCAPPSPYTLREWIEMPPRAARSVLSIVWKRQHCSKQHNHCQANRTHRAQYNMPDTMLFSLGMAKYTRCVSVHPQLFPICLLPDIVRDQKNILCFLQKGHPLAENFPTAYKTPIRMEPSYFGLDRATRMTGTYDLLTHESTCICLSL